MTLNSEQEPLLNLDNSSLNNTFLNNDEYDSISSCNTIMYQGSYSDNGSYNVSYSNNDINSNTSSIVSIESGNKCRICLQDINDTITYCKCLNTLSYIHENCLFKWLNSSTKNTFRNEEYDNHDEEYQRIFDILNNKNSKLQLLDNHYFYCEICHYRYNLFYQNIKTTKLYIIFDIILISALLILFFYCIFFLKNKIINEVTISLVLSFIFLNVFMIGTIWYSAYIKFYNYKLVIYPHHSKIE
jgi:hypothetical protein